MTTKMMYLRPSEIRFSQDSISNKFDNPNVFIGDTLDDLIKGQIRIADIPKISVKLNVDGNWVSADNRRLWVFKQLEEFGKCETIQVIETKRIPPFKNSSKNDGLSVKIRGGGNPGGEAYQVYEKYIKSFISIYKNTDKEQKAKIDSLSRDIQKMQKKLSDSEEMLLEAQERYSNSLVKLNAKAAMLEEEVKSLNTQLANSRQKCSKWVEAYRNVETAYKEKHLELEQNEDKYENLSAKLNTRTKVLEDEIKNLKTHFSVARESWSEAYKNVEIAHIEKQAELETENECLRNSQSAMEIKESKAKLQSVTMKLADTEEKYTKLQKLCTSNINTIDKLQKEIGTLKEGNSKMTEEMHKKDKRMLEIRQLTYDL